MHQVITSQNAMKNFNSSLVQCPQMAEVEHQFLLIRRGRVNDVSILKRPSRRFEGNRFRCAGQLLGAQMSSGCPQKRQFGAFLADLSCERVRPL